MTSLRDLVAAHRVIICAGSGGVGKTTAAAAIALWGAGAGRRTVVITIDPARRLATALGFDAPRGGALHEIPAATLQAHGLDAPGALAAMMLDQKGAWDALVERHAPSPEVRDRVLANPFYQSLSQTFAGSHEYMAIEELCRLHQSGDYDLIVVDTPPTKHALDFLEAPRRIDDFLDRRIVRWFVRPYFSAASTGLRLMNRTATFLLRRLEQATGIAALVAISDFFTAMSSMFDGFHERIERAYAILRSPQTAFVLVTGPEEQVLGEAEYLSRKMAELEMPLKGVVFNRVHEECTLPRRRGDRARGPEGGGDELGWVTDLVLRALGGREAATARPLAENFLRYQTLARGEWLRMDAFARGLRRRIPIVRVPNFPHDLHSVAGLVATHPYLFAA
jgi:anion-transporting  ArsA/GET3 family ATPase